MRLPRVYPILDTESLDRRAIAFETAAAAFLEGGTGILQIRHKSHWSRSFFESARTVARLCREAGAAMVVNDRAALARLEAIIHPLVSASRDKFLAQAQAQGASVVVVDIPLLFETEAHSQCDAVVVVSAPAEHQRRRALDRPGMTEEKFAALLAMQLPDSEKRRRADFVVDSSQGFDNTRTQIRDILRAVATMQRR